MTRRLHYGTTAKALHWLVVGLLVIQYSIGWLMPDIKRGMNSGLAMTLHISIGTLILIVIVARLVRRLAHPVAPECSLAPWQRLTSEAVHWLLYVLVLATTVSGWLFASARGWTISWFYMVPPMPQLENRGWPDASGVHPERRARRKRSPALAVLPRWRHAAHAAASAGDLSHN